MAQFSNQATISYIGGAAASNIVTGEVTQALTMTKTATAECYRQGDMITYVIAIRNIGTSAFGGLTLTDNLGAYTFGEGSLVPLAYEGSILYYINGTAQATPTVTAGPPLTVTGIDVPAGGDAVIIYRVRVGDTAPLGEETSVTNTAALSGGGIITPIEAQATVGACAEAALSIVKSLSPNTVTENGRVTYTFTINNSGAAAADASAGIVFSDTFDPILDNITVTLNGTVWTADDNYTYDTATGVFTTTAGQITVPAAAFTQNAATGVWSVTPGTTVLEISGTI